MTNYLDKKISLFYKKCNNKLEAFQLLNDQLLSKNCVSETFLANIIKREEEFPTGLQTKSLGIAIPHTDAIYAYHPQIAFLSLKEPVKFQNMDGSGEIDVYMILMLVLTKEVNQLAMLQKLMVLFKEEGTLEELYRAETQEAVEKILQRLNEKEARNNV